MKGKHQLTMIGSLSGLLLLILDGKTAVEGAQAGIELCLRTIIPSLFPFFVLSILLTSTMMGKCYPILRFVGKLFKIPPNSEPLLIPAFLGGYPVGAQAVASAYRRAQLSREDAQQMLSFCSNPGPAFIFGMAALMLPNPHMAWAMWAIIILGALVTAQLFPCSGTAAAYEQRKAVTVSEALHSALTVTASVCGWVILFRILIVFLQRWILWMVPVSVKTAVIGFLELSNGCCELAQIPDPSLRFILCTAFLSFGGVCVAMQTVSVTEGLSMKNYYLGKLLQTIFCVLISSGIYCGIGPVFTALVLFLPALLWNKKNNSSIPASVGV